jgi:hypothetical protein
MIVGSCFAILMLLCFFACIPQARKTLVRFRTTAFIYQPKPYVSPEEAALDAAAAADARPRKRVEHRLQDEQDPSRVAPKWLAVSQLLTAFRVRPTPPFCVLRF